MPGEYAGVSVERERDFLFLMIFALAMSQTHK